MSTANMPDLLLLTQQITSLKSDIEGVKERVFVIEEGGGGGEGGGGAAYPDSLLVVSEAGTVTLTSENQGLITATVSGVTFNLPEVAADGATFKLASLAASMAIAAGSGLIINFLSSNTVIPAGAAYTFVAINVDLGGGLALYWSIADSGQISVEAWNPESHYMPGMKVTKNGRRWMSIHTGSQINFDPETQASYWMKLPNGHSEEISGSIDVGDISFGADTAPSGFVNALLRFKSVDGIISLLTVDANYGTPGVDVNQVVIGLGDFADANPSVSLLPSENTTGTAFVNGAVVACSYNASARSITIDLPSSGIVGTVMQAKIVF